MRASVLQCELFQLSERVKQMRFHLEHGNLIGARRQALQERLRKTRQQQSTLKWILREAVENYYREQRLLQAEQEKQLQLHSAKQKQEPKKLEKQQLMHQAVAQQTSPALLAA
eukprot:CAMPEP_0177666466 /NCGR_PEP_ID=MMETSP0447-20121125/21602_1 /TAXON_ID=0 /ORGANISM="Stygamoeba regulata, Strain BSH-02190019" /LENGTH=112 /DNA_ID=CAMNT_0019172627 /DNA_START=38 /DNA_END=376 /DNA_ORIENTATION=+